MDHLEMPIFATGEVVKIELKEKLYTQQSHFQNIDIVNTVDYGKCLIIDGIVQTSEFDHELYDKILLGKLTATDKHILILGGGDGYVAQMALTLHPNVRITIVDLDIEVINACRKYLEQNVFEDKRVKLVIGDAFHYMKTYKELHQEKFDGIVCDLTDNPVGGNGNEEKFFHFYAKMFEFAKNILKDSGWISVQAGSSVSVNEYIHSSKILSDLMINDFHNISRQDVMIPSFGEQCAFLFGEK
jgi:spermidine synthase